MTGTPVEVWETLTRRYDREQGLLPDSGGAGEFRGGLGQEVVLRNDSGHPMVFSCLAGRTEFPPRGVLGGKPGRLREVQLNGKTVHPKGRYVLQPGDRMTTFEAGGGGYGDPARRSLERIRAILRRGSLPRKRSGRLWYRVTLGGGPKVTRLTLPFDRVQEAEYNLTRGTARR